MRILSFIKKMYTENCLKETTGMMMYRFQIVKAGELSGGRFCPSFLEAVWCRCGITGQGATIYFQRHRISREREIRLKIRVCVCKRKMIFTKTIYEIRKALVMSCGFHDVSYAFLSLKPFP